MWFRLAALWGCTVAEAQDRCDPREFDEWAIFWRLEPWGADAEDLRAGIVAAAVANFSGNADGTTWAAADFMPRVEPQKRRRAMPWRKMRGAVQELIEARKKRKKAVSC